MKWAEFFSLIKEKRIFHKKKDLNRNSKRYYRTYTKSGLATDLPMSHGYGMFSAHFISEYAPEKFYVRNMKYIFDRTANNGEGVLYHMVKASFPYVLVDKEEKKRDGTIVKYQAYKLTNYRPEDAIELLSVHPNLVNHIYKDLKKFIHKELSYKLEKGISLDGQDRALALILSRIDACNNDIVAIPTWDRSFPDSEYGFSITEWYDVLNVLIVNNFFERTHGDGSRKGAKVVTLPDEVTAPRHYAEANYIPSLLIPYVNYFKLVSKYTKRFEKEALRREKKEKKRILKENKCIRICGQKRKIPVEFVNDGLDPYIQMRVDRMNKLPGYVCRRSLNEFAAHLNDLGMYFSGGSYSVNMAEIENLYNKIVDLARITNFNYCSIIHVLTRDFRKICSNMRYCRGAFKWITQYVVFGQTENKILNKTLGLKERFSGLYDDIVNKILKATVKN